MAIYEVNMCCGCATEGYPCIGNACPERHAQFYKCDKCGADELTEEDIFHNNGDYCHDCAKELFPEEFAEEIWESYGCEDCVHCVGKNYSEQEICKMCGKVVDGKPIDNFKLREEK